MWSVNVNRRGTWAIIDKNTKKVIETFRLKTTARYKLKKLKKDLNAELEIVRTDELNVVTD